LASGADKADNRAVQTLRERFLRTMRFQKPDRLPFFEFGYWEETLPAWREQGLPGHIDTEAKAYEYFGIEDMFYVPSDARIIPAAEPAILEETDEYIITREDDRSVRQINKHGHKSIPHFLEYPIKNRDDWKWFKERLDPDAPERLPADFARIVAEANASDGPVNFSIGSLCGVPRNWMGFEEYAIATLTDPDFMAEIVETLTRVIIRNAEKAFAAGLKVDVGSGWEDITFNSGPIVHPDFFYREAVPRYKRICDVFKKHGVEVIYTDSDGNINRLVDGWLDAGINCMFPLEANGGTDPVALREKYGHGVLLMGGVDKMKLHRDKKTIERELERLRPVVEDGAFIPHVDHRVPPTVTLDNYKFYLDVKRQMFGCGKLEPQYR
jgi:uroporphyrinogen decarboxylase